ncbi:MAG: efflux RND transporter periplasmic adaptor subunit [Holophagales bacterium]|jgi:RND family efflux transporter MFP subunit|nr:efflux RND transporter periplasmic adaptor subunit [Holophagales bacterium]
MLDAARLSPAVVRLRAALSQVAALSPRRKALAAVLGAVVLVGAGLLARRAAVSDVVGEVRAVRGTLRITVAVSGLLAPARAESYGPEVAGVEMKVAELAPEGSWVAPGALLVRFDDAPFRGELAVARSRLVQTSGEAEQARQALRALLATQQSERLEASAAFSRAELDLKTFVNGLAPLQVQQSAAAVERARREAEESTQKLEGLAPFAEKGFVSRDELRAAERRATEAAADLVLAGQQHRTLTQFTHPQLLAQKTQEVESRKAALRVVSEKTAAQAAQAKAAADLADARAAEAARTVADVERRIALCTVTARSPGLVVHREIFEKGGEKRRVRIGDAVFAGQPVLDLPDLSEMLVETRVKEGEIHRVEPGQKAEVRLEAFPDETFAATVLRLGALTAGDRGEARTFPLVLKLTKPEQRLRPGMSAQALVLAGEVRDAVQVPVDAVRYEGDQAVCTVRTVTGTETRRLKTGRSNAFFVEIRDGLAEGDVVLISR